MSAGKIGCLVLYAVLAAVALTEAGSSIGALAIWVLLVLVVVHAVEVVVFFRLCQQAGGSLPGNMLQVFVFGYFHTIEMKAAVAAKQPG
ncbi:MAG: hypothetical protein H6985_15775 [Pseudomonadales bacterium]|nr:hypothetical protein [Halioglobus sp.]MCP5131032.1 hypothetical protein [Pseudomonadales bacterium]